MPASLSHIESSLAASPKQAERRLSIIVEGIVDAIDDAIDAVGVEAIVVQANALYDKYIQPVDVPWVPDVLEPLAIDAPAKQIIAALIRGLHERMHKEG